MENVKLITKYEYYLKARRMAVSTQKTYMAEFKAFLRYFSGEDYRYISRDNIIKYLAHLYDMGYSASKVNQAINAIKFYKEKVLGQKRQTYFLKRPRRKKFLPNILSIDQMFDVINSPGNLKHHTILFVLYDNGLRKGELINLKLQDVRTKTDNPHIIIREAKYNSSRIIYLSDECLHKIKRYYRKYKPQTYLFEGAVRGECISGTTIANVLKRALRKQGITERLRVHDLRHNFATHCLMNGTDIYHLSKVLGHKSVETTEKYYAHLLPNHVTIKRPQPPKETPVIHLKKAS